MKSMPNTPAPETLADKIRAVAAEKDQWAALMVSPRLSDLARVTAAHFHRSAAANLKLYQRAQEYENRNNPSSPSGKQVDLATLLGIAPPGDSPPNRPNASPKKQRPPM